MKTDVTSSKGCSRGLEARGRNLNTNEPIGRYIVNKILTSLVLTALTLGGSVASADEYSDTISVFKNAGQSATYLNNSYGYAVFPSVGKGGLVVGAAHGNGKVYEQGKYIGDSSLTQVSVGLQAGGEAFRQIIFFETKAALDQFISGNFEFGADVNAVAIKSGASGSVGTTGATATASSGGGKDAGSAATAAKYYKGMAVFTVVKGGAMVQATVGGQKFSYKPVKGT
jgi:lipid-binding SYLF domain-containing protein